MGEHVPGPSNGFLDGSAVHVGLILQSPPLGCAVCTRGFWKLLEGCGLSQAERLIRTAVSYQFPPAVFRHAFLALPRGF